MNASKSTAAGRAPAASSPLERAMVSTFSSSGIHGMTQ
jgi:hypothetical protein